MKKINKSELLKLISKFSKKKVKSDNDLKKYRLDSLAMMKIILELIIIKWHYFNEIYKNNFKIKKL